MVVSLNPKPKSRRRQSRSASMTPGRVAGILVAAGTATLSIGLGLVFAPLGFISAGALLLAGGVVLLRGLGTSR
jgi:hypothetical protein